MKTTNSALSGINIAQCTESLKKLKLIPPNTASDADMVNKPPHYTDHPSGVECIDITRHMNFNIGNTIKYCWRAGLKSSGEITDLDKHIQDLSKARWYISDEINRLSKTPYHTSIKTLQEEVSKWAEATFVNQPTEGKINHLKQEFQEFLDAPTDGEEMADIVILLMNIASRSGIDLEKEINDKFQKNKRRAWGEMNSEGICNHLKKS